MRLNKAESAKRILEMCSSNIQPCTKLQLDNIVFPKWSDLGLVGMMFRQCVMTKEQPNGNIYEEATFQTVMRIIGGKVLMSGRPDCYCWKLSKVQNAKNFRVIGSNSASGILTLLDVLSIITNIEERTMMADMFASWNKDLLLVTTPAESRKCIEITQALYNAGVIACVDEWMEVDSDGNSEATILSVGDFLIVSNGGVYCIRRPEMLETHTFNK